MSTMQSLNTAGQTIAAVLGTIIVNAAVQPLCTVKNLMMTKQHYLLKTSSGWSSVKILYKGYSEACLTDSANYAVSLLVNEWLKKNQFSPLTCAIAAGVAGTPVATVGEALMLNRQLGNPINMQLLKGAMHTSGLIATLLREIPYCVAIFAASPAIEPKMPFSNDMANKSIAGLLVGGIAGALTGPADTIRALVQAKTDQHPNGMSFAKATISTFEEFKTARGAKHAMKNSMTRAVYIGLAVGMLNLLNNKIPEYLANSESFTEQET